MIITDELREAWRRNGWAPHLPVLSAPPEPVVVLARTRRCATCSDRDAVVVVARDGR